MLESNSTSNTLYPTVITKGGNVQVSFNGTKGILVISDAAGRQILLRTLTTGSQSVDLGVKTTGIYFYNIKDADSKTTLATGKIVVE